MAQSTRPTVFPGEAWEKVTPESVGFSPARLAAARARLSATASTGLVAIAGGRVVFEFGNVDTVSSVASVRKSILSMLFGIHVERREIDLDATLGTLEIDDHGGLTDAERQARVRDLLTARSGVFLPAANEGDDLANAPARGTQPPGTYFLYSNWDFNALGTVFERSTGQNIFDAFQRDIATPIELQDFRRENHRRGRHDPIHSSGLPLPSLRPRHGAPRLSHAPRREVGRSTDHPFGVGRESTRPIVPVTAMNPAEHRNNPWGYGYLWWVWDGANTPPVPRGLSGRRRAWAAHRGIASARPRRRTQDDVGCRPRGVGRTVPDILDLLVAAKTGGVEHVEAPTRRFPLHAMLRDPSPACWCIRAGADNSSA